MAKQPTITNLTQLRTNEASAVSRINTNFANVRASFLNTLSLDGSSPNQMSAPIDMNSNRILNLPAPSNDAEPIRKAEYDALVALIGSGVDVESGVDATVFVANLATLRLKTEETFPGTFVVLQEALSGNRAGAGFWSVDASDTTSSDNGFNILVDASGRRWKPISYGRANRPTEIIDLEYFLSRYSSQRTALIEAHKALFNDTALVPARLECHGIQIQLEEPLLLRNADFSFSVVEGKAEKTIANLHLKAIGSSWDVQDFMYSIAGTQSTGNLRYFTLDKPVFNANGIEIIPLHISGYYHNTILRPKIRGLVGTGVGIYSSRYEVSGPGVGFPGGTPEVNSNNGCAIIQPDIRGTSGSTDATTGIYTEDGDFVVEGGWMSFLQKGIVSKRGGCNISDVHFSMADRTDMTIAVQIDAPRSCSIVNNEFDGSCILFDNPTDNVWMTDGSGYPSSASLEGWSNIHISGGKFSGTRTPGGDTADFGHINFKTRTANNYIRSLTINPPEWAGGSIDTVKFIESGSGTWLGSSFNEIIYNAPHTTNSVAGTFPTGTKIRLIRTGTAGNPLGLNFNPATGAVEFLDASQSSEPPYIKPSAKGLHFGRVISGTETDRWLIHEDGHLRVGADGVYDLGHTTGYLRNIYLKGLLRFSTGGTLQADSGTATCTSNAATLSKMAGVVTTESLSTAADTSQNITITNTTVAAGDIVLVNVSEGTSSTGIPVVGKVQVSNNTIVVTIRNVSPTTAFNGTLKLSFLVVKA